MHPLSKLKVPENKLAVHWFGQSSFAVKSPGSTTLYCDPYFPRERPSEIFIHPDPPVYISELPVDGILFTHNHLDHTNSETIQEINRAFPEVVYVGPPESTDHMEQIGIAEGKLITVNAGDTATIGDVTAHFLYSKLPAGDPDAKISPPDVTHLGIVLECGGSRIYISGDPVNNFADNDELTGAVKSLSPQAGFLTNHPDEGEFPFTDGSVKMAVNSGLQIAVPSHYQCFIIRNYDPQKWAKAFEGSGVETRIVSYNAMIILP
jgi:L-ascorbate metabolism protein UlaG (beta-lactamase superfamily)